MPLQHARAHEPSQPSPLSAVCLSRGRGLKSFSIVAHDISRQGLALVALETVEGSPVVHDYTFPRRCALLLVG